jgi:hypothetical protein
MGEMPSRRQPRTAREFAKSRWDQHSREEAFNLIEALHLLVVPTSESVDGELASLFDEDQADRLGDRLASGSGRRDRARRDRGLAKLFRGEVGSARDYYHLAMLLQHGGLVEHYHLAHELALRAGQAGWQPARWLAAAAMDRWLMTMGLTQRYGTQYVFSEERWKLYPVDLDTTDEERERWGVPSLDEARTRADEMNHENPPE